MKNSVSYNGWTDDIVFLEPDIIYSNRDGQDLKLHLILPMWFHYARKNNERAKPVHRSKCQRDEDSGSQILNMPDIL